MSSSTMMADSEGDSIVIERVDAPQRPEIVTLISIAGQCVIAPGTLLGAVGVTLTFEQTRTLHGVLSDIIAETKGRQPE